MFGCKVKLQSVQNTFGFRWREKLVKARRVVGVQLILNDRDALGSPESERRPVHACTLPNRLWSDDR